MDFGGSGFSVLNLFCVQDGPSLDLLDGIFGSNLVLVISGVGEFVLLFLLNLLSEPNSDLTPLACIALIPNSDFTPFPCIVLMPLSVLSFIAFPELTADQLVDELEIVVDIDGDGAMTGAADIIAGVGAAVDDDEDDNDDSVSFFSSGGGAKTSPY